MLVVKWFLEIPMENEQELIGYKNGLSDIFRTIRVI